MSQKSHLGLDLPEDGPSFPNAFCKETKNSDNEDSEVEVTLLKPNSHHGASKHDKLTYQCVAEKASSLVCLAQLDPMTLGSHCDLIHKVL